MDDSAKIDAERVKEAYRLALSSGLVARYRDRLGYGEIIRFKIDRDEGFSDGSPIEDRIALAGEYQLRHYNPKQPDQPATTYAVMGRLADGKEEWIPCDGPWKCGDGPFDRRRT